MADEGMTFLDAHTPSSACTPTRYGLLTGRYNWRSRLARGVLSGTSSHLIPASRPTLGHLLQGAGYHTSMIGKWHLGWDWAKDGKQVDHHMGELIAAVKAAGIDENTLIIFTSDSYETSPPTGVKAKPSCSAWRRR